MYKENDQTPFFMWKFECGDGWFNLINDLSSKIEKVISSLPDVDKKEVHVTQVKEKFASLRVYMSFHNQEIEDLIALAEVESNKTCEKCGTLEGVKVRGKHYISTMCEVCYVSRQ